MDFQTIRDENHIRAGSVINGHAGIDDLKQVGRAHDMAILGLLNGYPDLGFKGIGSELGGEAYQTEGSPYKDALQNSIARVMQQESDKGLAFNEIDPLMASRQIAIDTAIQIEAQQALKLLGHDHPPVTNVSLELGGGYVANMVRHAREVPHYEESLRKVAMGLYDEAIPLAQNEIRGLLGPEGDNIYPGIRQSLEIGPRPGDKASELGNNMMYDESAADIVGIARGKSATDEEMKDMFMWHGLSMEQGQQYIEATKIVIDIAEETSPTRQLVEDSGIAMPALGNKIIIAVENSLTDFIRDKDDVQTDKLATRLLADVETQISAEALVDAARTFAHGTSQEQEQLGKSPQLKMLAEVIALDPMQYKDHQVQATGLYNEMSQGYHDVRDDIVNGRNLTSAQKDLIQTRTQGHEEEQHIKRPSPHPFMAQAHANSQGMSM